MGGALRILQTGEFRLDEPLLTGNQLPESLKNIALEARYHSTSTVINTAISENVDVLIIAGNAFDWSADRRPAWFLAEQFNRLDRHGIQVVWAELKENAFPGIVPVPSNVHKVTPRSRSVIQLSGRNLEFCWDWQNPPAVAAQPVAAQITFHRNADTAHQGIREISYTSHKHDVHHVPVTSIQGAFASQAMRTGAQLINWNGTFENTCVSTETVRWVSESIEISPLSTRESLESELRARQLKWQHQVETQPQRLTLCHWTINGSGPLWNQLVAEDFQSFSRSLSESDSNLHHFWSTNVELVPDAAQLSKWRESNAVAIGIEEFELHFADRSNLIPESYQKPAWATQFKSASLKKSVVPHLVSNLLVSHRYAQSST